MASDVGYDLGSTGYTPSTRTESYGGITNDLANQHDKDSYSYGREHSKDEKRSLSSDVSIESPLHAKKAGRPIDWNGEFQMILELPELDEDQRLSKYNRLTSLSKDFVGVAKRFGKVSTVNFTNNSIADYYL
jgi:hypothetical protein